MLKNKYRSIVKNEEEDSEIIVSDKFNIKVVDNHIYFTGEIDQQLAHELAIIIDKLECVFKDKKEPIVFFHICSPGGDLIASLRIYDRIKYSSLAFVAVLEGAVCSGGTMIMCGCDYITAYPNTEIMIHELSSGVFGRYSESTNEVSRLKTLMDKGLNIYNQRIKKTKDKFDHKFLEKDQYVTLKKCKEIGLIDEIIGDEKDK